MSLVPDFALTVAQIQQQCMVKARREYETVVQEANLQLTHARAIIEQQDRDKLELKQFLTAKLQEVCISVDVILSYNK